MIVVHKKTNQTIASKMSYANTVFSRMKGLMFMDEMKGMDALLIDPCNSIHNCFVRFPLDVLFLDKNYRIVKIIRHFKPWRFSWIYFRAKMVIEMPSGKLSRDIEVGDEVEVSGV